MRKGIIKLRVVLRNLLATLRDPLTKLGSRLRSVILTATSLVLLTPFSLVGTASATPTITEYTGDSTVYYPADMAQGADGAMWFIENGSGYIGRVATDGTMTTYQVPPPPGRTYQAAQNGITLGPDGNIWFTEGPYGVVGNITPAGVFTQYTLPAPPPGTPYPPTYSPQSITTGSDGALWFTEGNGNAIGRITTTGDITEYPLGTCNGGPGHITNGPDGALWFANGCTNTIGRMTTSGVVTTFPQPATNANVQGLTFGPDGALWFAEHGNFSSLTSYGGNKIGRMTTDGTITEYPLPNANSGPMLITNGPDGALWFTESGPEDYNGTPAGGNRIGRITTSGDITEYAVPTANSQPWGIATGSDGNMWFTENRFYKIGKVTLVSAPAAPTGLTAVSPTKAPALSWNAATGATGYSVYRDGTHIATVTGTTYIDTTAADGTHTYYVTATNAAGASAPSNTVSVVVDTTRPVVTVTPAAGSSLTGTVTFNITISDANPLSASKNTSVWVYLYNTLPPQKSSGAKVNLSSGSGTFTVDTTKLLNGSANLDVGIVYDAAGNASGTSDNYFRNFTVNN